MNYFSLLKTYTGIEAIVHDRSYDGLEMPAGYEKPTLVTFEGWQADQDRLAGMEKRKAQEFHEERELRATQVREDAKKKSLEEIRPYEEKLKEIELEERELCLKMQHQAIAARVSQRENILSVWKEISATQEKINQDAQSYLEDTKHVLAWNPEAIPKDIAEGRALAHARLQEGETVYADWRSLRSSEMPPRMEIEEAIRKGGEHLERIKKICKEVQLRYPKPKRSY